MLRVASFVAAVLLSTVALAAPSATQLFFDTAYLPQLPAGTTLNYVYKHVTSEEKLGESFDETLAMKVEVEPTDAAKRVADVEIHRGDRIGEAGPFPTQNGNPIALVLLERDVRELAQLSKGSPFYLRNRVREHLATSTVEPTRFSFGGKEIEGWKMTMVPFAEDPNKDKLLELGARRYEFIFADEVPGGLYSVRVVTPAKEGTTNIIETSLTLTGVTAPGAK